MSLFEDNSQNIQDYVGITLPKLNEFSDVTQMVFMAFDGGIEKFFLIKETDPSSGSVSLYSDTAEYIIGLLG